MQLDEHKAYYREMIGLVPPKVAKRLEFHAAVDPEGLEEIEAIRKSFLESKHLDAKTVQLLAYVILLTQTSAAAEFHARAAIKAGATREELFDASKVAFLFRGLSAINHAGEVLEKIYGPQEADKA
ncbi:carboxymuconolactone decarboxylase family protein [Amorphus coralli]|uniref:carboxymuconolactone decarboxylase family protein n=1 Tax=Amorphus coralli TaxID=340680 RepID=UPI000371DF7C|nr:carboxymuconolactone decarboxylase family protein [Amorphus coralli]